MIMKFNGWNVFNHIQPPPFCLLLRAEWTRGEWNKTHKNTAWVTEISIKINITFYLCLKTHWKHFATKAGKKLRINFINWMIGKNDKLSFLSRKALNSTTLTLYFRRNGTTYYTGEMDSIIHRDGVNGLAFCNHLHVTPACMHFISTKCLEVLHYKWSYSMNQL